MTQKTNSNETNQTEPSSKVIITVTKSPKSYVTSLKGTPTVILEGLAYVVDAVAEATGESKAAVTAKLVMLVAQMPDNWEETETETETVN